MNISSTDIALIFASALAIILLSFLVPAMGLADASNETAEADIPEFNISANQFNLSGDFPKSPGTPSTGTLTYNDQKVGNGDNKIMVNGSLSQQNNGNELIAFNISGKSQVRINLWKNDVVEGRDKYNVSAGGDTFVHQNNSYRIEFNTTEYDTTVPGDPLYTVKYEITQQPDGQGFLQRIPVVGGIVSVSKALASVVAYIGSVLFFVGASFVEALLNFGSVAFQTISFFTSLLAFMLSTYNSLLVNTSASWATVLVSVPGILFALEFTKLAAVSISELTPG